MAKATYEYPADVSFRDAARVALLSSFHKMMDNADATRSGVERREPSPEEIEALHDMRVGSRRLRAALSLFGKVFPKDDFKRLERQTGDVTDALGAVRDLDVQIDSLRAALAGMPANEAYGVQRLIEHQTERRDVERKALIVALDRLEKERFARGFKRALDRALPQDETGGEDADEEPADG